MLRQKCKNIRGFFLVLLNKISQGFVHRQFVHLHFETLSLFVSEVQCVLRFALLDMCVCLKMPAWALVRSKCTSLGFDSCKVWSLELLSGFFVRGCICPDCGICIGYPINFSASTIPTQRHQKKPYHHQPPSTRDSTFRHPTDRHRGECIFIYSFCIYFIYYQ